MKKNLGLIQAVYPMPVLMVAAYDENTAKSWWPEMCAACS